MPADYSSPVWSFRRGTSHTPGGAEIGGNASGGVQNAGGGNYAYPTAPNTRGVASGQTVAEFQSAPAPLLVNPQGWNPGQAFPIGDITGIPAPATQQVKTRLWNGLSNAWTQAWTVRPRASLQGG